MRIPQIHRTKKRTIATCLVVDTKQEKAIDYEVELNGAFINDNTVSKAIEAQNVLPDHLKFVHVKDHHVIKRRYGLLVEDFFEMAVPMEPGQEYLTLEQVHEYYSKQEVE